MSNEWVQNYLDETKEIRENYNHARTEFGWNVEISNAVLLKGRRYSLFRKNNELRLFVGAPLTWKLVNGKIPQWDRFIIALTDILYFCREGEIFNETKVSGGGNSGPNIGGAIIGGIIAGPTGAMIGGQSKTQPIATEVVRRDERKTILVCSFGSLEFAPDDYHVFMKLIPDKEISATRQEKSATNKGQDGKSLRPEERLRILKDLHKDGLLTDKEFEEKRKELIALL